MRPRNRPVRSCTYAVTIDGSVTEGQLQALAQYLSTLGPADCDVLVLDSASQAVFDSRECVLRWVGRHVPAGEYRDATGRIDRIRAAAEIASTEKIIVASMEARYTASEVREVCTLLERHDVVEPEEYVGSSPWWGSVEAGGLLLYRGVEQRPQQRSTCAFRRSAYRPLRGLAVGNVDDGLAFAGSDVFQARNVFVRREPRPLFGQMREGSAPAFDAGARMRSILILGGLPLLAVLALIGGVHIAVVYAGVVAAGSILLAVRGRIGASQFFPLAACLLAPLWIVERSLSAYWSVFDRFAGGTATQSSAATVRGQERAASGQ